MLATDYPDVLGRYLEHECGAHATADLDRVEIIWVKRRGAELEQQTVARRACRAAAR
jgi:hypothetical protein